MPEPYFQHIQCQECELVRAGEFLNRPETPLARQHCPRCSRDTDHSIVDIEVISCD